MITEMLAKLIGGGSNETNGNGKPHAPHIVPVPPDEAFDEKGNYQRHLDKRTDCVIRQPVPKYAGQVPVYIPTALEVSIAIDDGTGIVATLELALTPKQFDEICPFLNGAVVQLFLRSVRPVTTLVEMSDLTPLTLLEQHNGQHQGDTGGAFDSKNWKD